MCCCVNLIYIVDPQPKNLSFLGLVVFDKECMGVTRRLFEDIFADVSIVSDFSYFL